MGEGTSESGSESGSHAALSLRFLGLLNQPADAAADLDPELDESDVVWSDNSSSSSSSHCSLSSPPAVSFPSSRRRTACTFAPGSFGLSALLESGDGGEGGRLGSGPLRRQSSPITPPVAVPSARSSPAPRKTFNQSAPVAVPVWPGQAREARVDTVWGLEEAEEGEIMERIDEGDDDDMEEMVPPHVIVARSHMTSCSVLEGAGRTLKGRDLRRVRNAVFKKTGFLDV